MDLTLRAPALMPPEAADARVVVAAKGAGGGLLVLVVVFAVVAPLSLQLRLPYLRAACILGGEDAAARPVRKSMTHVDSNIQF